MRYQEGMEDERMRDIQQETSLRTSGLSCI